MKFPTFPTLPASLNDTLKKTIWAMCTLLGTGLFATAMVQPFDVHFNGWELLFYTLKNESGGGSPRIHFVLLMVVEIMLMLAAMFLILSQRIHVMLILVSCFLLYFGLTIGKNLWLWSHSLLVFSLLAYWFASYCLPERHTVQPVMVLINAFSLIYVLWMVMKMPLLAA